MYHYYYYDATTLQDNMLRYLENHGMYERDMTDISDIDNDYEMELWVNVFVWNNVLYKGIES